MKINIKHTLLSIIKWVKKFWIGASTTIGSLVLLGIMAAVFIGGWSSQISSHGELTKKVVQSGNSNQVVAVLRLNGVIVEDASSSNAMFLGSSLIESNKIIQALRELSSDDQIKAVVLRINSPGGSAVASDDLYQAIVKLSQKKPVVASLGDVAASGGYYIAAAANKIVTHPATITGSIGVIIDLPKLVDLYDKLGVEMRTIQSGPYKDMGSSARDLSLQEQQIFQSLIDQTYQQFVKAVAQGRDMEISAVKSLADGRIYSGNQAVELSLADQVGSLSDAQNQAVELAGLDNPTIAEFSQVSFWDSLLGVQTQINLPLFGFINNQPASSNYQPGLYYLLSF